MVIINKVAGAVDYTLRKEGRIVIAPGEEAAVGMNGQGSSLSVSIDEGDTCAYAVEVSQSALSLVESDAGKFIPAKDADSTDTDDFYIEKGSVFRVVNRAESTGSLTVDWRI